MYNGKYNVIGLDYECSCFTCDKPTRLFVWEFDHALCMDCIMILTAVVAISEEVTKGREQLQKDRDELSRRMELHWLN